MVIFFLTAFSTGTTLVVPATTSAEPTDTVSTPQNANAGMPALEGQLALIPLFSILAFFLA